MPFKPIRDAVFVSYSHADKKWLDRIMVHLKPLERDHNINIWIDTKLRSGDKWQVSIDKALAKAKVAILLISADFMASDFIHTNELPPLLQAAAREGLIIIPVIIGGCSFAKHPLGKYQAINGLERALKLLSEGQVDEVLAELHQRIHEIFIPQKPPVRPVQRTAGVKKTITAPITPANPASKKPTRPLTGPKAPVTRAKTAPTSKSRRRK